VVLPPLLLPPIQQISAHVGDAELEACLKGCELVVIPAGVPRKPGMTRDDLFNINAGIVMNLVTACAKYCPNVSGWCDRPTPQRRLAQKQREQGTKMLSATSSPSAN
jgi:hypothetical protein